MKRFLSVLLAAVLLLSLCPAAFAAEAPAFELPVLPDGFPEEHMPPIPELRRSEVAAFSASSYSYGLTITISQRGEYFEGVTWTAEVSGGNGSYYYVFDVVMPVVEDGKTVYYGYGSQEGSSNSFTHTFDENGEYELWVNVYDSDDNSAREVVDVSVHVAGHDPLDIDVVESGTRFTDTTTWTVETTGGSGEYSYMIYLYDDFSGGSRVVTYKGNSSDNTLSYQLLASGEYRLLIWLTDTVTQKGLFREVPFSVSSAAYPTVREKAQALLSECKAASCKTDYEIALWMHDWLINNADYDETYTHYGADGVLCGGTGVCDSYSKAYCYLLEAADIPVMRVTGVANGGGHSWNAVQLADEWYYADATWDDPTGGHYERHLYCFIPEEILTMDHTIDSAHPDCTSYAYNYFAQNGDGERWASALAPAVQKGLQAGDLIYSFNLADRYSLDDWYYSARPQLAMTLADNVTLMLAQKRIYSYGNESIRLKLENSGIADNLGWATVDVSGSLLDLPDDLTQIEAEAFQNASGAMGVAIPEQVKSIGTRAFAGCDRLWGVIIPASVTSFGTDVFDRSNSHLTLVVAEGSAAEQYAKQNGLKYRYTAAPENTDSEDDGLVFAFG